jgi:transposase InsO family protein
MGLFNRKKAPAKPADKPLEQGRTPSRRRAAITPLEVKLLALEALQNGLTRSEVAEIIGVAAVTIGAWQKKYDSDGLRGLYRRSSSHQYTTRCRTLEQRILERRDEHPEHGVRRIRDDLRRKEGLSVSAETVRTVVNEAGVGNPPKKPGPRPPQVRRFERPLPNALWQIDIFTFQLKRMYRVYMVGIIDDHSRYLVGWGLFRQQTAPAVLEVVKGAIGQWGAPREILSDNGRQFVAWRGKTRFQKVLKQQGIGHVRSAPHHPMTLGKIERFWQTLWTEFLSEAVFASFADACQRLDHWVQYYNHQRPHQGIDGACPADRFYGVAGDVEEAVKQGCKENALRLALGQEPRRPLFLLGQLGDTDVRVVRRGDELEIKVGDAVREVIKLRAPYEIGEDGHGRRDDGEVAESERSPTAAGDREGASGPGDADGAVPGVWDEPSGAAPSAEDGGGSGDGGAGAEATWPEEAAAKRDADQGTGAGGETEGSRALEPAAEVRGDADAAGTGAEAGPRGTVAGGGKKKEAPPLTDPPGGYVGRYSIWADTDDGDES